MDTRKLLQQTFGLTLIALMLAGCGGAQTGTITGMVLEDDGTPLENIYDQETLIVALFCLNDDSDIECLHEDFWDMDMEALFDSICEADDAASNCMLHLGQSSRN